jgi:uncharacterized protein (TIGR03067 family)
MLTAPLLLALALAPADAPAPPDGPLPPDAAVYDAGELQGEWEVVSLVYDGQDVTKAVKGDRWRFAGTTAVRIDAIHGKAGQSDVQVNPAAVPPTIDRKEELDDEVHRGVYRRTGDQLVWALIYRGRQPSSFEPAPGVLLWTLRRVKK